MNKLIIHPIIAFTLLTVFFPLLIGCENLHDNSNITEEILHFDVPNAKIAYKVYGDGKPLIMCMGYGANMDMWDVKLIEYLKQKYKVIVFDYRGMGLSTNSDSSFTINTLAEDVNLLCNHLHIEKASILGWSMGGYVAQSFAIKYPKKVNKLILYATDTGGDIVINPEPEILNILSDSTSTDQQMIKILFPERWFDNHPESKDYFSHVREPINHKIVKLQDDAVSKWLTKNGGASGSLYKLTMPTLIISGDSDSVVLFENSEILYDSIANSTLIKIKNGGHGLMYQYPKELASYIKVFIDF